LHSAAKEAHIQGESLQFSQLDPAQRQKQSRGRRRRREEKKNERKRFLNARITAAVNKHRLREEPLKSAALAFFAAKLRNCGGKKVIIRNGNVSNVHGPNSIRTFARIHTERDVRSARV
jgi:hypothetical protein